VLNTAYSGPQAWLLLAQDKGYLAETGLDIAFTTGEGAFTAAPRMVAQGFDFGYGDVNSLVEVVSKGSGDTPVGVFMMFNASPSTIAVRADGPIKGPADLKGRTLSGHATDVALRTFGAFCETTGLDRAGVAIQTFDGSMRAQVEAMLAGRFDGVFGYVSTITAAMASAGIDAKEKLRFINYARHTPDLYGSCLMATRRMIREEPKAVAALVRAINRGLVDVLKDKDAAIDAVVRRDPAVRHAVDKLRLQTTLDVEMSHAEGKTLGIGDVDEARLLRSIQLVARTNGLPRAPALADIFDRSFLPSMAERVTSLAG
jgi:NitT/TauT family transport system substrate-binding protein